MGRSTHLGILRAFPTRNSHDPLNYTRWLQEPKSCPSSSKGSYSERGLLRLTIQNIPFGLQAFFENKFSIVSCPVCKSNFERLERS